MLILTIRTDKPDAEIGIYNDQEQLKYEVWLAHRQLSLTLNQKIETNLAAVGKKLSDVQGIVAYQGPGSFTGLRIGLTVANTLAYSIPAAIVGMTPEDDWIAKGIIRLQAGEDTHIVLPEYGADAHITAPRK